MEFITWENTFSNQTLTIFVKWCKKYPNSIVILAKALAEANFSFMRELGRLQRKEKWVSIASFKFYLSLTKPFLLSQVPRPPEILVFGGSNRRHARLLPITSAVNMSTVIKQPSIRISSSVSGFLRSSRQTKACQLTDQTWEASNQVRTHPMLSAFVVNVWPK